MTHAKNLDNASGKLFLAGFMTAKLRQLPIPFIGQIIGLISAGFYLIGYALWLIACHFYPDHTPKKEAWYGFAQVKHQNRVAAGLGFIGITLSLLSFIFPVLLLPGAALFAISNIVWSIAEYHRRQNPPKDASYLPARQNDYVSYAILSTLVSVMTAASLALVVIFPPIGAAALFISALIGFSLTIAAFYFLLKTPKTSDIAKPETEAITSSTALMNKQLSTSDLQSQQSEQLNQSAQEPAVHQPLFQREATDDETTLFETPTNSFTSPSPSS